jgi:DNA helicase HerA-like ATPase
MTRFPNHYFDLLKIQKGSAAKTELFSPPTATLDVFRDGQRLDIDFILKKSPLIMGKAGSGKSNAAGIIMEQILEHKVQIFLEDFAGEHGGIVEMFEEKFTMVDLPGDAIKDAEAFFENGKCAYLDCSKFSRDLYLGYLDQFLSTIYQLKVRQDEKNRKPTLFVFEECHNFIPESMNPSDHAAKLIPKVKEHLRKFALEGRKYGCPTMLLTQRPSLADKSIIAQARLGMFLQVTYPLDVKRYSELIPGVVLRELRPALFNMKVGDVYFVLDGHSPFKRRFKRKKSPDLAQTPGYAESVGWREGKGTDAT